MTSVGPAAVPVSVVRAVRDAGSARQSGPLICILVLGCRRSSISTHVSSVSHVSQSSSWHSSVSHVSQSSSWHSSVSHVSQSSSWHSSVSHVSQSSRGTWSSRCMQRRRHTLRTTPTTDTPRTMGGYRARSGIAPQTTRRTDGGEAESHTHRSSTDTLHVSARSMWPALSPRSYLAFSTAACGHAPRRAGLGGRPRSRTRCGHARWLRWLRA